MLAVDYQGRARDAAKLHGQCVLAEVGEEPLCGVAVLRSVFSEPVLRAQSDLAIIEERDVEQLVVAFEGGDVTRLVLGGRLDVLKLIGVFRRSPRGHFFPELLSVFGSEGWRRVQEHERANTLGPCRCIESDHMRSKRVSGESDLLQLEPIEQCIEVRERAGGRDAGRVVRRARATPALVEVDELAAVCEYVEGGPHVGESESRAPRDDHERCTFADPQVRKLCARGRHRPCMRGSRRHWYEEYFSR